MQRQSHLFWTAKLLAGSRLPVGQWLCKTAEVPLRKISIASCRAQSERRRELSRAANSAVLEEQGPCLDRRSTHAHARPSSNSVRPCGSFGRELKDV
jgi:hypothetical protein